MGLKIGCYFSDGKYLKRLHITIHTFQTNGLVVDDAHFAFIDFLAAFRTDSSIVIYWEQPQSTTILSFVNNQIKGLADTFLTGIEADVNPGLKKSSFKR